MFQWPGESAEDPDASQPSLAMTDVLFLVQWTEPRYWCSITLCSTSVQNMVVLFCFILFVDQGNTHTLSRTRARDSEKGSGRAL